MTLKINLISECLAWSDKMEVTQRMRVEVASVRQQRSLAVGLVTASDTVSQEVRPGGTHRQTLHTHTPATGTTLTTGLLTCYI